MLKKQSQAMRTVKLQVMHLCVSKYVAEKTYDFRGQDYRQVAAGKPDEASSARIRTA